MFNFKKDKPIQPVPGNSVSVVIKNIEISVVMSDITEFPCDALVYEANTHFNADGGLAAMVKLKGGKTVEAAMAKFVPAKIGDVLFSPAAGLPVKFLIHAVTTGLNPKIDTSVIRKATYNSLLCAQKNNLAAVSFPVLGQGLGDMPYEAVSKLMAQEIFRYIQTTTAPALKKITIVCASDEAFDVFKNNICAYLNHLILQGPFLVVSGVVEYQDGIVLVERTNPPFGWSLPGGFVDYNESVEVAVAREVQEETNLAFKNIRQLKVYSDKDRDPRFHTVVVAFAGKGEGLIKPASDAKDARLFKINEIPAELAFDHRKIIDDYLASKK